MAEPAAARLSTCWRTVSAINPTNRACTTICRLVLAISFDAEPARVRDTKPLCSLPGSRCTAIPTTARRWPSNRRSRAGHYQSVYHAIHVLRTARLNSRDYSVSPGTSFGQTPHHGYCGTCPLYHLAGTDNRHPCCYFHCRCLSEDEPVNYPGTCKGPMGPSLTTVYR